MIKGNQKVLDKIDKLLAKFADPEYPEDKAKILEWQDKVQRAMIVKDLSEHEGIIMIVDKLKEDLKDIRFLLNTAKSEKLSESARDRLIDKKLLYVWFLGLFIRPDEVIKGIEEEVDEAENELEKAGY
ncbi:MAG: hypothetical protein ABIH92_05990 [Nanoarchaeota archaeon]